MRPIATVLVLALLYCGLAQAANPSLSPLEYETALKEAAKADGARSAEAVAYLLDTAWGESPSVNRRRDILHAISSSGKATAHEAVRRAVCDPSQLVSAAALRGLGRMRWPGDFDVIEAVFAGAMRHNVRCEPVSMSAQGAADLAIGFHQRIAAIQALGDFGDSKAVPLLLRRVSDASADELRELAAALIRLGAYNPSPSVLRNNPAKGVIRMNHETLRAELGKIR